MIRRAAVAVLLCAAAAAMAPPQRVPRALALLIGIGDYRHFTDSGPSGQTDLHGPGNDVERMRLSLRRFGFGAPDDTRILRDGQATRAGIAAAFQWLATRATDSADVVVIYYSGHGSYTRDLNGDEHRLVPGDQTDEALVPWDASDIQNPAQLVVDDQIGEWLAALRTANVTVVLDACFSGTATRGAEVAPVARARGPIGNVPSSGEAVSRQLLANPRYTMLSAASASQVAMEVPIGEGNRVFGVFTYHLTRALDAAGPTTRYDDIMRQLRQDVATAQAAQTPQLEGARGARLFNVGERVAHRAFVVVTGVAGGVVTVDAGAIHGVRPTAVYDVYGAAETAFAPGAALLQIQVDSVAETRAFARPLAAAPVPVGARAVLARVPRGAASVTTLRVHVDPSARTVRPALDSLAFVEITDSARADAFVVRADGAVQVLMHGTPIPALEEYAPATRVGSGFAATRAALCAPLARGLAIRSFQAIENPEAPLGLRVSVSLVETGRPPDDAVRGVDTVYVGKFYDLYARVDASEVSTLYLTAAVVGYLGEPMLIHPGPGGALNQPFELNKWLPLSHGIQILEPVGVEVLKVVAGSDQFDLGSLVTSLNRCTRSAGVRGDPPATGRWRPTPQPVRGWRALDHRIVILRSPAGG